MYHTICDASYNMHHVIIMPYAILNATYYAIFLEITQHE